jgi:hypothetical protein
MLTFDHLTSFAECAVNKTALDTGSNASTAPSPPAAPANSLAMEVDRPAASSEEAAASPKAFNEEYQKFLGGAATSKSSSVTSKVETADDEDVQVPIPTKHYFTQICKRFCKFVKNDSYQNCTNI